MTIWIVGQGIVGRRINACSMPARRSSTTAHRALPVAEGEIAVLCRPDRHAPLAEAIGAQRLGRDRRADFDDAQDLVPLGRQFQSRGTTLVVGAALSRVCRSWCVTSPVSWPRGRRDPHHIAIHGTAGPACA